MCFATGDGGVVCFGLFASNLKDDLLVADELQPHDTQHRHDQATNDHAFWTFVDAASHDAYCTESGDKLFLDSELKVPGPVAPSSLANAPGPLVPGP